MEEMSELEQLQFEVIGMYEDYIRRTENRGASYGEIAYIEGLSVDELEDMMDELLEEECNK